MSTDNNKENKNGIVKANILALPKNSSGLVRRAIQDIDIFANNPNLLIKPITKINPIDGAEMVWVPSGTFTMGSPHGVGFEKKYYPAHQVTLSGYWIYKYEVTVVQYRAFCDATGHDLPEFPEGFSWEYKSGWDDPDLQRHPIVNVSWDDCKAYADWAGANLPPRRSGNMLPVDQKVTITRGVELRHQMISIMVGMKRNVQTIIILAGKRLVHGRLVLFRQG